jgi:hypothetical protein
MNKSKRKRGWSSTHIYMQARFNHAQKRTKVKCYHKHRFIEKLKINVTPVPISYPSSTGKHTLIICDACSCLEIQTLKFIHTLKFKPLFWILKNTNRQSLHTIHEHTLTRQTQTEFQSHSTSSSIFRNHPWRTNKGRNRIYGSVNSNPRN